MNFIIHLVCFIVGFFFGIFLMAILKRGKMADLENQVWYYEQYLDGIVPIMGHDRTDKEWVDGHNE